MIGPHLLSGKDIRRDSIGSQPRNFGREAKGQAQERRLFVTFPTADAPVVVYHGLGRKPSDYIPVSWAKGNGATYAAPGKIYSDQPLPCDSRTIVLKCDTANTVAEIIVR